MDTMARSRNRLLLLISVLALTVTLLIYPVRASATGSCIPPLVWNGCQCVHTPIIIDTSGEGFHLTSTDGGVVFDFSGDGHRVPTAWTAPTSRNAFLALDRNHNGRIDDGGELFGNVTKQPKSNHPNGFLALAVFDKQENGGNGDGIIDERDAVFSHLLLWIDVNHDGISQPNELHSLPEMGVYSLALKYKEVRRIDEFGNQFRYRAAVNPDPEDGESKDGRWTYDVFFTARDEKGNPVQPRDDGSRFRERGMGSSSCFSQPTISGPNTVWWFNGQSPSPTTYPISITLTSTGGAGTTWSVNQADAKVNLSSTSGAQIRITCTGSHFSATANDISITATANDLDSVVFTITTRTPAELSFLAGQSGTVQDDTYGYVTDLNYNILDQLGAVISGDINWNEVVGPPTSQNGSNWGTYALQTGGGSTPLLDELSGPQLNANPPPSPKPKYDNPPIGATVYLLATQLIRVGSSTSGSGDEVQSDNLTYYIDQGAHTSVVLPPPPPK
jgi:hypothetical protein